MRRIGARKTGAARQVLLCSVAMLGAAATPALAQDAATQPAAADDTQVSEIIVTAQRREERLQDVPLSIAALTGEELRNSDIRDVTRLEQAVPGLRFPAGFDVARGDDFAVATDADTDTAYFFDLSRGPSGSEAPRFLGVHALPVGRQPLGVRIRP